LYAAVPAFPNAAAVVVLALHLLIFKLHVLLTGAMPLEHRLVTLTFLLVLPLLGQAPCDAESVPLQPCLKALLRSACPELLLLDLPLLTVPATTS
jgi:hypothetical protein